MKAVGETVRERKTTQSDTVPVIGIFSGAAEGPPPLLKVGDKIEIMWRLSEEDEEDGEHFTTDKWWPASVLKVIGKTTSGGDIVKEDQGEEKEQDDGEGPVDKIKEKEEEGAFMSYQIRYEAIQGVVDREEDSEILLLTAHHLIHTKDYHLGGEEGPSLDDAMPWR